MRATRDRSSFRVPRSSPLASLRRCAGASLAGIAVEFALLTALVSGLHIHYLLGSLLATGGYLVINFALNRRWARGPHGLGRPRARPSLGPQLARHLGSAVVGMTLGTTLLWLFVHEAHFPYPIGWATSGCIVFGSWTWPTSRRIFEAPLVALDPRA